MKAHRRVAQNLALLLATLAVIGMIDQLVGPVGQVDPASVFRRRHAYYHHDLRPSVLATTEWGKRYEIVTNSLGFRDGSRRQISLRGELRRVLLMGDSFTEGVGVSWEESFAGRLAQVSEGSFEILNAGVVGYSPRLYHLKTEYLIEQVGLEFDELVVFIDMSDISNEIIYQDWQPREEDDSHASRGPGLWHRLRDRSYIMTRIDRVRRVEKPEVTWNTAGMPFAEDLDVPALQDPEFNDGAHWTLEYKYAAQGLALATANMDALAILCFEHGISLTIVIYPWPANVLFSELSHPQVEHWRAFTTRRGARFVNLFPVFISEGNVPRDTLEHYFIEGDIHWNAAGHELVANELAPLLSQAQGAQDRR